MAKKAKVEKTEARKTGGRKYHGVYRRARSPYWWIKYALPDGRVVRESAKTTSVMEAVHLRSMRLSGVLPLGQAKKSLEPEEEPTPQTLREFATEYLELQRHLKSFDDRRGRVNNLLDDLGDIAMEDLTARDFEKYRARRMRQKKRSNGQKSKPGGCRPATVNRELSALKHMMRKARSYRYISREAFERISEIRPLKEENAVVRYLTRQEEAKLLQACTELAADRTNGHQYKHLYPIVLTALRTGMRKSEILALRRENVNLEKRIIHVEMSKSGKRRDVPVPDDLLGVLRTVLGAHCMEYVFWHGKDRARTYRDVPLSFKRALRRAGITAFRFHDCRHHYASHFVMNGGNILHLQKILGHQSVQMTERYAHLAPDFVEEARRVLNETSWAH